MSRRSRIVANKFLKPTNVMSDIHGRKLSVDRRSHRDRLIAFVSVEMTTQEHLHATIESQPVPAQQAFRSR